MLRHEYGIAWYDGSIDGPFPSMERARDFAHNFLDGSDVYEGFTLVRRIPGGGPWTMPLKH